MRKSRLTVVTALTAVFAIILAGLALADDMANIDGSTELNGNDLNYNTGGTGNNFACEDRGSPVAGTANIRKKNDGPGFKNGAVLTVSGTTTHAGITVANTSTTLPTTWQTAGNNTAHPFDFDTTVSTAVTTGTYTVTLRATGELADGGTGFVTGDFTVNVDGCSAPTTSDDAAPTIAFDATGSYLPNGSSGWWKTGTAKVKVTATDASGVTALECTVGGTAVSLTNTGSNATQRWGDIETGTDGQHSVSCGATDGGSGAAQSPVGSAPDVPSLGEKTVSVTGHDVAGNSACKTLTLATAGVSKTGKFEFAK